MADFFSQAITCKVASYSILETTKQIFVQRNDPLSIDPHQKVKNDIISYHLGQLNRPVSQIGIQCNMVGFVVEGHII